MLTELEIEDETANPSFGEIESLRTIFFICSEILILYFNPLSSSSSSRIPL